MKLYRFADDQGERWARLVDDVYLAPYSRMQGLAAILAGQAETESTRILLSDANLIAPVESPSKIVCVGINYLDHCRETNTVPPPEPLLFAKFTSAISGPGAQVAWSTDLTSMVDFEAELVVMIGTKARHVPIDRALDYVAGYMCGNDISARDLQLGDEQWTRGKSLDGFAALGPCLVTADEVSDPQSLTIECRVNDQVMQSSNTSEMIYGVAEVISYCSTNFTLEPGDIIMTGTPHGVALGRTPSPWLVNGDEVTVSIEGLGELVTLCVAQ